MKSKALIVDDEMSICTSLVGVLSDEGWDASYATSGREGYKKFSKDKPDLVLLDVWMQGWDGIQTLQKIKDLDENVPIIVMSGHGTIETAVKATKLGAYDFLEKPLSIEKLIPLLDHAKKIKKIKKRKNLNAHQDLIGLSENVLKIRSQIEVVAPKNSSVLITGENGTGKEVVAKMIHLNSLRKDKPFIAINCAAIPEELIESELFGHEKGAFTNAANKKIGKFELADQGTLFLDEIGDMSLRTQAKVLRILQEKVYERVGGTQLEKVDVRVIAATNKNLETEMEKGHFREDLYYRLNVVPFHLKPIRERGDDVITLANSFFSEFSQSLGEPMKTMSPEVKKAFLDYRWPGNVRELKNLAERLCILVRDEVITLTDLPENISSCKPSNYEINQDIATLKEAKSEFEKSFIVSKLEENAWNVSKTSEAIGIERSHLHRKLKAYDIDPKKLKPE